MCSECVLTAVSLVSTSIVLSPFALRYIKSKKSKHKTTKKEVK